jgi:hypothetical protein
MLRRPCFDPEVAILRRWHELSLVDVGASGQGRELVDRVLDRLDIMADDPSADPPLRLRELLVAGMSASSSTTHLHDPSPGPLRELSEAETVLRVCDELCAMFQAGMKTECSGVISKAAAGDEEGAVLDKLVESMQSLQNLFAHTRLLAELRGALETDRRHRLSSLARSSCDDEMAMSGM